jgi:hypothetical protein
MIDSSFITTLPDLGHQQTLYNASKIAGTILWAGFTMNDCDDYYNSEQNMNAIICQNITKKTIV